MSTQTTTSTQSITTIRNKRPALGRGLSALIPSKPSMPENSSLGSNSGLLRIPIEKIKPNSDQPRQYFDDVALGELSASIREHGVLQPIVVRREGAQEYRIVAGERRWRAAQKAGLHELPAVISEHDEDDSLLLALVENVQREDLNPIEEAEAYLHLAEDYQMSQDNIAKRVGKDRSTVSNAMRLLKLPQSVRDMVACGQLSMGHARALLGVEESAAIERLARSALNKKLSVRDVEKRVKLLKVSGSDIKEVAKSKPQSPAARDLTERLMHSLSTRVVLKESGKGKGSIEISFGSLDELDRLIAILCR
jgi:ParB family chromosome partitioning protein